RRGDANADGFFDIGDSAYIFSYLTGGPPLSCMDTGDVNDDGYVNINDGILGLNYLYFGGSAPLAPYPGCGQDPTGDSLPVGSYDAGLCGSVTRGETFGYAVYLAMPAVIEGPPGSTVQFEAAVRLFEAAAPIRGWSLSVGSSDVAWCRVVDATAAGTVGASYLADPPGLVEGGVEITEVTTGLGNEGAISAVMLTYLKNISLDPANLPYDLLRVTFEAVIPTEGEHEVVLDFVPRTGSGQVVENVLATSSESIVPVLLSRTLTLRAATTLAEFTYQGRLSDGGTVAEGEYDFRFRLFDEPNEAGLQLGNSLIKKDVQMIHGMFSAVLDFGGYYIDGRDLWLEVGVKPGGIAVLDDYTALAPRQKLTNTPYAVYARKAESVVGGIGITGGGTSDKIAKFFDATTLGDSEIYESGGNVGIG
ncbi:MAG: hypothetical protein GY869_05375, partial [Planctomycetes bacterium]|nr:hypothetical protein [Planctomycetota bacterium]